METYKPPEEQIKYISQAFDELDKIVRDTTSDENNYPQIIREGAKCCSLLFWALSQYGIRFHTNSEITFNNLIIVVGRETINCLGSQCEVMMHEFLINNKVKPKSEFKSLIGKCLKKISIRKDESKKWHNFWKAFVVLRNKASHGDKNLLAKEKEIIKGCMIEIMLSEDKKSINFRNLRYIPIIVSHLIEFSNILLDHDKSVL